jgi:hypothetical protein
LTRLGDDDHQAERIPQHAPADMGGGPRGYRARYDFVLEPSA